MNPPGYPRRILMTADTIGGVWDYALELSRGLGQRGVAVTLATMGPRPSSAQREHVEKLGNVTLCESAFRLEWMEDPWRDVERASNWLLELTWEFRPDLVHLNGFVHGALPWSAPTLSVGHSCVLSWWQAVHGREAPAEWNRYREAVTTGLHGVERVVAPSQAMLDALQRHYGPLPMAKVIPNGRAAADFRCVPEEKENVVLSVGRLWDEGKNIRALAAIAPELAWPVRVAGDRAGPDGSVFSSPNVDWLGRCSPAVLAGHYARASIYALPARYEPFGLSVLEAALSGCALVLGDIPSLRELWGDAAVFVPPNDHDRLRDAINGLSRGSAWRQELARRARRRAEQFTVERMVNDYLATYASLRDTPLRRVAVEKLLA